MFGDVGQARTNAAMLLKLIATTSSRTCTKPTVGGSFVVATYFCLFEQESKVLLQIK